MTATGDRMLPEPMAAMVAEWRADAAKMREQAGKNQRMPAFDPLELIAMAQENESKADEVEAAWSASQATLRAGGVWQPIESAPRDGTPVLLLVHEDCPNIGGIQFVGRCYNADNPASWGFAAPVGYGGIHESWLKWRPLPAAPDRPMTAADDGGSGR